MCHTRPTHISKVYPSSLGKYHLDIHINILIPNPFKQHCAPCALTSQMSQTFLYPAIRQMPMINDTVLLNTSACSQAQQSKVGTKQQINPLESTFSGAGAFDVRVSFSGVKRCVFAHDANSHTMCQEVPTLGHVIQSLQEVDTQRVGLNADCSAP